jgi:hypothetical protein
MARMTVVNDDHYREINRECVHNPFHGNLV